MLVFACLVPAPSVAQQTDESPTVVGDAAADKLAMEAARAKAVGDTPKAIELSWSLLDRLNDIWGPHHTAYLLIYMGMIETLLEAERYQAARSVLDRAESDLGTAEWFSNAKPDLVFARALISWKADQPKAAEHELRTGFELAQRSQIDEQIDDCHHILFSLVLRENGKPKEADSSLKNAANPHKRCGH